MGSPVAIRFVPERPENNTPVDWGSDRPMPVFVVVLVPAMLVFLCGLLQWFVRCQKNLLSEGKAVMGIVRKTHRSQHGQAVTFEYTLPDGQVMRRRSGPTHRKLQTGSIVTVLYDPEKPTRTALYPMELVRIDDLS